MCMCVCVCKCPHTCVNAFKKFVQHVLKCVGFFSISDQNASNLNNGVSVSVSETVSIWLQLQLNPCNPHQLWNSSVGA